MHITLLPPLLPTDGVTSVAADPTDFVHGARVVATVVATSANGDTVLSFAGRQVPVSGRLPFPPGARLRLEVVATGSHPVLRLITGGEQDGASTRPEPPAATASVAAVPYGLAAALMAASEGRDVAAAAAAVAQWLPVLASRGLLSAGQAAAVREALVPVPLPTDVQDSAPARQALADAITRRVTQGGLLLERQMADLLRRKLPLTPAALGEDVRVQLAYLSHVLAHGGDESSGAMAAVRGLQEALLAEQARTAAHLARDGGVDVRLDVWMAGEPSPRQVRLRIDREGADGEGTPGATEWSRLRIDLAFAGLGHVQVGLTMAGPDLRAEFIAERPDTADVIEAGMPDLGHALATAGFRDVLSRVVVDPVRACAPDSLPSLPERHAILDARA